MNAQFSPTDSQLALESAQQLAHLLAAQPVDGLRLHITGPRQTEESIPIPTVALQLLQGILVELAQGNAVTMVAAQSELTTRQAAEILNVSRPFLVELLEQGGIPFRKVGTHRRVLLKDLMAYKQTVATHRLAALEELSAQDQRLGLGY